MCAVGDNGVWPMRKNGKPVTDHQKFAENSFDTSGDPFNDPVYFYILRANSTTYLTNLYKIDDSTYVGIYK